MVDLLQVPQRPEVKRADAGLDEPGSRDAGSLGASPDSARSQGSPDPGNRSRMCDDGKSSRSS